MMYRYIYTRQIILKNNPALKHIESIAYQFGRKGVDEYCTRVCRQLFGAHYFWEIKSPYFKGTKLTKKGRTILEAYRIPV